MEHMELGENVVALNFQNLFHFGKSLRTFKISTFFHHGSHSCDICVCVIKWVNLEKVLKFK